MVEKNPWWNNVQGPFPTWNGPVGVKQDGGGCHRGRGKVGNMLLHQAVNNHDRDRTSDYSCLRSREQICHTSHVYLGKLLSACGAKNTLKPGGQLSELCTTGIVKLIDGGENVNEVEAAGNTPLHCAAYEGWQDGVELLLSLGAKIDSSNNAGDRPWHWADNMGHDAVKEFLLKVQYHLVQDIVSP